MKLFAFIFLCSLFPQFALACNSAIAPSKGQVPSSFYDADSYGVLGVGDRNYIWILDEYRCYDLSSFRNKNLAIYFNNARRGESEPTYIGALIVRTFRGTYVEGRYSAYVFRSTTTANDAQWVRAKAETGELAASNEIRALVGSYDPEDVLRASDLSGLDQQLRIGARASEALIGEWHAKIAKSLENKFLILRDTAGSNKQWTIDARFAPKDGEYLIARSYLIKYQPSSSPRPEVFFTSGAASADCVYIRLIAPGDEVTTFSITKPGEAFYSLKMRSSATCVEP